ncbi:peptide deformylase [Candidatus Bathyarchaeota archaeon]|nr:peptide deformylase [Candidatus Bathyarchaeota archaeon]
MVIKEILLLGDSRLRNKSDSVQDFSKIDKILIDLKDTLTQQQKIYGMGRGISAPQLGYNLKIVYIQMPDRSFYLINPVIKWSSDETFDVWDSCFSLEVAFFVKIKRSKTIRVKYYDETGKENLVEFSDGMSELLQHEIDHLEGIICSDHLKNSKDIIMRSEWVKNYKQTGLGM